MPELRGGFRVEGLWYNKFYFLLIIILRNTENYHLYQGSKFSIVKVYLKGQGV